MLPVQTHKPGQTSLTVLAFAASIALLYYGRVFFITVVIAVIIAFLLDPVVTAFVKLRLPRAVASFVVCSISLLGLYLLGFGLFTEFSGFVDALPIYSQRMNEMVDNIATQMDQIEKKTYQVVIPKRFQDQPSQATPPDAGRRRKSAKQDIPPAVIPEVRIHAEPTPLVTYLYGYLKSFYDVVLMASKDCERVHCRYEIPPLRVGA